MKILLTGQAFYRKDNGQAVFTVNLAEGLAKAGHSVLVLAPSETGNSYTKKLNGVQIQTVPAFHLGYNLNISGLSSSIVKKAIKKFNPDIIHIQDHYFLSRDVLNCAKNLNIPVVGTNHFLPDNITDNLRVANLVKRPVNNLMWKTMLVVFNQLKAATSPTQTAVDILKQQEIRITLKAISCGINTKRFYYDKNIDKSKMRDKYQLSKSKPIFLYVGRVDREKNIDLVINAIAELGNSNFQFAVAGKGSYLEGLERMVYNLGLGSDMVKFLGFVPDEDLSKLLNSVDYFVMPSDAELQSIATIEAMACGLPILAANARALPELVEHKKNGYLFESGNIDDIGKGIDYLVQNIQSIDKMRKVGLKKVKKHAIENTIREYVEWYESCI